MAFVIPTSKITHKTPEIPGPGNYDIIQTKSTGMSCAPFNSTTLRKQNKKKQQILPGPGQYNNVELKKVYEFQTSGNHMFLSKVERFKQAQQTIVDPAQNSNQNKVQSKVRVIPKRQSEILNYIRKHNQARKTISIKRPTNYVRIIYNNPNNTQNNIEQYIDIDFMNRNLGPGQYDVNKIPQQHIRAISWSKSNVKRFEENEKNQIGPGSYHQQQKISKTLKNNAVFAYQGVRTHFQSLLYKTNIQDVAHLRQYIKYKDPQPGPGYYESKNQQIPLNLFQFFGSTSERFLNLNKMHNQTNSNVGPGSYLDSNEKKIFSTQEKKRKKLNKLRATTILQNQKKQIENQNPGPASYYDKTNTLKQLLVEKFKIGYHGQFGTKQQRFKTQNTSKSPIPGPGQYHLQQNLKMRESNYSTYISKSKRLQNKKLVTPFGKYEVGCKDISKQLQKKIQFIQNLKKISVNKPPFQSTEKRFKTLPTEITHKKNIQNLSLQAENLDQKNILKKNNQLPNLVSKFNTTEKRFVQKIEDFPPPGHYHTNNVIQKHSYNIKYGYKKM